MNTLNRDTIFTNQIPENKLLRVPIAHGEGCYFADQDTIKKLQTENRILFQYVNEKSEATEISNPNGSVMNIAGICNDRGNVAGLMPHPERACDLLVGSDDGRWIFESLINSLKAGAKASKKAA